MNAIALQMLLADRIKYLSLIFAVAFSTMLMSQQVSIFIGLMLRTASQIIDVREADIWVMDPRVVYVDEVEPLTDYPGAAGARGAGGSLGSTILQRADGWPVDWWAAPSR